MNKILCLGMASLLLLGACKSRKKARVIPVKQDTSASFRMQSDQQKLERYAFNFQYLTIDATGYQEQGNDSRKLALNIRMLKDSLIWIRVSQAGIEGARILINRDSLIVLDRIHTNYYVYPVSYLKNTFNIELSFDDLQRLLVGNLIFNSKEYKRLDSSGNSIKIGWDEGNYKSESTYSTEFYRPQTTDLRDKKSAQKTTVLFSDFDQLNGQNLARKIAMDIFMGKEPSKVTLVYNSVNTNKIEEFPFFIPSSYERKH